MTAFALALWISTLSAAPVDSLHVEAQNRFRALPLPDQVCTVLAGEFESLPEAEDKRTELEAVGYGPVEIVDRAGIHQVHVGQFDIAVDAHIVAQELNQRELSRSAEAVRSPQPQAARAEPNEGPIRPVFDLEVAHISQIAERALSDHPVHSQLEAMRQTAEAPVFRQALIEELGRTNRGDSLRGYILTRLGIMDLLAREYDTALEHLEAVADHRVPADPVSRIKAMIRVAWITHQQGDRLRAYQAYNEIGQFTGSDAVRARCAVECVGLVMELARHDGIGSVADSRHMAQWALSVIPADQEDPYFIQRRSTVELMFLESFTHEGDREASAALGEEFIAHYATLGPATPWREVGQAMYHTALNHFWLGNWQRAEELYNRILTEVPPDTEFFAGENPLAKALVGISMIRSREGRHAEVSDIYRRLIRDYPHENVTITIRETHPNLVQEED